MNNLSAKEKDLLKRIDDNEDLRPLFFRKVKGLKWFDVLNERGYFNPEYNPKPTPAKEEGYINIPHWSAIDYLVKTAPELSNAGNGEYVDKYIKLLITITNYAKHNEFSNYRTWWQFSEIISHIPSESITTDHLDIIDFWLSDKYESDLVAEEIGIKWLPKLLAQGSEHDLKIAAKLVTILYRVIFVKQKNGQKIKVEPILRFDKYHAKRITAKVAHIAGDKLGLTAIRIFENSLKAILLKQDCDSWSYIWQPAIEEHEQNKYREDPENILIEAYRDSLQAFIKIKPEDAMEYIASMFKDEYQTIQRIALDAIGKNSFLLPHFIDTILDTKFLECANYRHEMWHLLNNNYQAFSNVHKKDLTELVQNITRANEDTVHEDRNAYDRAIWLSAIKDHGEIEANLYNENIRIAKVEPDHPDFSSYMSTGRTGFESPIPIDELQSLSLRKLLEVLKNYKNTGSYFEPGIEGLARALKQVFKSNPLNFYSNFRDFADLDLAYVYEIIEAYSELWNEKKQLPWDDIWPSLLNFCLDIIKQDRFWGPEGVEQRKSFVANRYWIVSSIGRLIEAGTKSDDNAFSKKFLITAEQIISFLLENEKGNEFDQNSDAVSIAINSPRGHCLEALINLTLRSCRIADKENNKDHLTIWTHFQKYYDAELDRAVTDKPEYEFATLVTNYLPNFLYMSKDWVMNNLGKIFSQEPYMKWLCAMQGYAYVGRVYQDVYEHLKLNGDFIKALDDDNIKKKIEEKVIENIVVAYINQFEQYSDSNSLISTLLLRGNYQELRHLIWFLWTLRNKEDTDLKNKVCKLWAVLIKNTDFDTKEGKKMASQLCKWAVFIDQIGDENRNLILTVAPYADEDYNAYSLLQSIALISQKQPFEAYNIWKEMLKSTHRDYPEKSIREIFQNLTKMGHEGLRKANDIASEYIKKGNDRPAKWLGQIKNDI